MIKIQILIYKIFETTITNLLPGTQLSCTWCILRPLLVGENLQLVQGENVITQDFKRTSICQSYVDVYRVSSHLLSREVEGGLAVVAIHFQVKSHPANKQRFNV